MAKELKVWKESGKGYWVKFTGEKAELLEQGRAGADTKKKIEYLLKINPDLVIDLWLCGYPDLAKKYKPYLLTTSKEVKDKAREIAKKLGGVANKVANKQKTAPNSHREALSQGKEGYDTPEIARGEAQLTLF